jgi:putative peptidoglycan lipid II flippase
MQSTPLLRMGALLLVIAVSAATYFGALLATGFRFSEFKRSAS